MRKVGLLFIMYIAFVALQAQEQSKRTCEIDPERMISFENPSIYKVNDSTMLLVCKIDSSAQEKITKILKEENVDSLMDFPVEEDMDFSIKGEKYVIKKGKFYFDKEMMSFNSLMYRRKK